jgi:hypothetical protein
MVVKCVEQAKGLTLDKEYKVINSYGIGNGYKLEIKNDEGVHEEYDRYLFIRVEV